MMRKIKMILILLISFILTGCKGDDIRNFRSVGYDLSGVSFNCKFTSGFKYLGDGFAVGNDDKLYLLSFDLIFLNKNNCKLLNDNLKVSSIYNNYLKMTDGKIYEIKDNKLILVSSFDKKNVSNILNDINFIKALEYGNYVYVLKTDGNVYEYLMKQDDLKTTFIQNRIIFNNNQYGKIVDFGYYDNEIIYIKSENKYYTNQITNPECLKYADVDCIYQIKDDKYLNKYRNKVFGYNGGKLILKDGKLLSFSSKSG